MKLYKLPRNVTMVIKKIQKKDRRARRMLSKVYKKNNRVIIGERVPRSIK